MKMEFEVLPDFISLWERNYWRYAILMGGRGAGRSTAASQYGVSRLPAKEYMRGAIMRAVLSDIRHSIWKETHDRILEQGIEKSFHIKDSDMQVKYGGNSLQAHGFRASSGSLTARLKSLANYNTVLIEEAEEIGEGEFRTLDDTLRTIQGDIHIIMMLNPPPKNHWIIQKWFDLEESEQEGFYIPKLKTSITDTLFITGNYRNNIDNLDKHTVERYEHYKITKPDYYWQMITGLVPEVVRGKIYRGWELINEVPKGATLLRFGVDWGWYPDNSAVIALYYYDGKYIIDELVVGTELEHEVLVAKIKNVSGWERIVAVCGADEPSSINIFQKHGIKAEKCDNSKGSVDYGIKIVSSKKIMVTKRSVNVWAGYEIYAWAEDKDGNPKGEPNHNGSDPMDAVRYAFASLSLTTGSGIKINKPGESYGVTGIRTSKVSVNIPKLHH